MPFGSQIEAALDELGRQAAAVDPRLIALALAFHLSNHMLRSLAWRNVIQAAYPDKPVRFVGVAVAYALGVALNAVAPARGGDAAKVGLVRAEIRGSSVATLAATISVLMVFDILAGSLLLAGIGLFGVAELRLAGPAGPAWLGEHPLIAATALALLAGAGWLVARRARDRVASLWRRLVQGGAVLRTPRRYVLRVALVQAGAWGCRIGVVMSLLAAFGLPASPAVAGLVMVLAGVSTVVPLTPGGAGTQQVLLAYALSGAASAAAVVSFSVGMQVLITAVNALLGAGAAMVACRTLRPIAAIRGGLQAARAAGASRAA